MQRIFFFLRPDSQSFNLAVDRIFFSKALVIDLTSCFWGQSPQFIPSIHHAPRLAFCNDIPPSEWRLWHGLASLSRPSPSVTVRHSRIHLRFSAKFDHRYCHGMRRLDLHKRATVVSERLHHLVIWKVAKIRAGIVTKKLNWTPSATGPPKTA